MRPPSSCGHSRCTTLQSVWVRYRCSTGTYFAGQIVMKNNHQLIQRPSSTETDHQTGKNQRYRRQRRLPHETPENQRPDKHVFPPGANCDASTPESPTAS